MSAAPLVVLCPGSNDATPADVGGKAASLIRMGAAGFAVPTGAVLTTRFFAPWLDEIRADSAWAALATTPAEAWAPLCEQLKKSAAALILTSGQRKALDACFREAGEGGRSARLAVRSSSPEEDLVSASFAGLYETRLGVAPDALEAAVRACFASCLDVWVLRYKKERGIAVEPLGFAVLVQQQLDSEIAGVGFSLNPVTNDYDEAVINANWGLGVTVVDGSVSPDHFVVSRLNGEVVEETCVDKPTSQWLDPKGGIVERVNEQPAKSSLTNGQLLQLTDVIGQVETLFGMPVDIEWAYIHDELYLLQARPITTYVPLPPEMITPPGERRRLYGDAALSKGLTTNEPISPLGLDFMQGMFSTVLETWTGPFDRDTPLDKALFLFAGSRMYVNYSNLTWLAAPKRLSRSAAPTDALMAETLASVDVKTYRSPARPRWMGVQMLWRIPRITWKASGFLWNMVRTVLFPEREYRVYRQKVEQIERKLRMGLVEDLPFDEICRRTEERMTLEVFGALLPALVVGTISPERAARPKTAEERALASKLQRGVEGNVVVDMGIALHRLTKLLDRSEFENLPRLAERLEQRRLPPVFLNAWDEFIIRFGFRGPLEMDVANPRYADDPHIVLRQMSFMAVHDGFDPAAQHRQHVEERRRTYEEMMRRSGPLRRALLRRAYRLNELFAGSRDTPKHLLVLANYVIRQRALAEGRRLVAANRLDAPEEVFELSFEDLKRAAQDKSVDLRRIRAERTHFLKKLHTHVTNFPVLIDSRGRILRPPSADDAPGLMRGTAVSPGVVNGPVKVLHSPDEKAVEKGDVLVAYTTDPGWTPLFVNVAAVVLEVGGVLQHGAVVAREYGKPCVVGIDQVVAKLHDGEPVEVDGTTGTVRRLS